MLDIYLGIAFIAAFSALLFWLALRVGSSASKVALDFLALGTVGFIVFYINVLQERAFLSRLLPFSNLIVIGNWFPLTGAFLGGLVWRRVPDPLWRKGFSVAALAIVCLYASYARFIGELPAIGNRWKRGVCMQTTPYSCSAAAGATLLSLHGIQTTETEMAQLSFTRAGKGTTWYGLYRGLKLKTAHTDWDVEIVEWDLEQLKRETQEPVILSVRLDEYPGIDPRYRERWGWSPGLQHAVVLLGFNPAGIVEMGDPSVGRELWSERAIADLWHGEGMRLVRRKR